MPPTVKGIATPAPGPARQAHAGLAVAALLLVLAGCATPPPKLTFTGDIMVDAPNAIQNGPPRDKMLWQYRLARAAMCQGDFALAKRHLDEALATLQGIYGPDPEARKSRGYFTAEAKKNFIGEPYERSMAYVYRGILYWMDGEPDNARACFRSAEIEDSDTRKSEFAGDWVLPDYLDGLVTGKLGGDGSDAFKRAEANAKGVKLPPYNLQANLLLFLDFGPGPTKFATGQYGEQLRFRYPPSGIKSAEFTIDGHRYPVAPADDVAFQATTRGGRVMDHVLANKAVFKGTTDAIGTAAIIGGTTAAAVSDTRTGQNIGLGIALAGMVAKVISSAATPQADTRCWDNLPRFLSFAQLTVPPGQRVITVQFVDPAGQPISNLTKVLNVTFPEDGQARILFVSDQSSTPQTL